MLFSLFPRVQEYARWSNDRALHFAGDVPSLSPDSFYWIRVAREYRDETSTFPGRDPLRRHPEGGGYGDVPALSQLLAVLSPLFGGDLYRTGSIVAIGLSSLFMAPLGLYAFRLRCPLAGICAGLVGSFSPAYYSRTLSWRVDTDGGNQLFIWLVPVTMLLVRQGAGRRGNLLGAACAGLSVSALCRWFDQPGFAWVYAATFLFYLAAAGFRGRELAVLLVTFLVLSNPVRLWEGAGELHSFVSGWLLSDLSTTVPAPRLEQSPEALQFPNLLLEVQELTRLPLAEAMRRVLPAPVGLAGVGLAAFALFAVRHWRKAILLAPVAVLGALGFLRYERFLMFAAPLAGFGLGYLLTLLLPGHDPPRSTGATRANVESVTGSSAHHRLRNRAAEVFLYAAGIGLLLRLLPAPASMSGRSFIPTDVIGSLTELRDILPPGAALWHTWSYGHLISDVTGFATFNDGASLDPVVAQLMAHGIASHSPRELHELISLISNRGRSGLSELIVNSHSYPELLRRVSQSQRPVEDPIYLLLTAKTASDYPLLHFKASWDFESQTGEYDGYEYRRCRRLSSARLECIGLDRNVVSIDLANGTVNGQQVVKTLLQVKDGFVQREFHYPSGQLYLQLFERGAEYDVQFLREGVFHSNFNQMHMLGRYNADLFEEVFSRFPTARVFRVRPAFGRLFPRDEATTDPAALDELEASSS